MNKDIYNKSLFRGVQQNNSSTEHETSKELYQCEECGLKYESKEIAEQCHAWCKEHKSCNLDIIKNAVSDI